MSDESRGRPTVQIGTDVDAVSVLSRAARAIGNDRPLFVRFRDNTRLRARVVLGDWMGGTTERPWPDVEILDGEGSDRINAIAEERWERIGELEEQIEELEKAIAAVGEALDRIDAPQGATYAERIDRLYRELTGRATRELAERHTKLVNFAVAQRDSHHTLREEDTHYAEYHRGAEGAYAIVVERLGGRSPGSPGQLPRSGSERLSGAVGGGSPTPSGGTLREVRRPEGKVPPGTRELRIVLEDVSDADKPPEYRFVELEDQDGRGIGAFGMQPSTRSPFLEIAIPYGRNDEWVSEVAYQAAGAASGVFLREDGEKVMPAEEVSDAVAELLDTFGIPRACGGCQEEQLEHGRKEVAKPELSRAEGAVDLRPPDEFDIGQAARERLHERLTEGPVPNPAELARVIDILR